MPYERLCLVSVRGRSQEAEPLDSGSQAEPRNQENADGLWILQSYNPGSEVYLESIDFRTRIEDVYEDVIFPDNETEKQT